jgi:hypothetical protein
MANIFMTGFEWGTLYEVSWWDAWNFCSIATDVVRSGNYSIRLYGAYASFAIFLPGAKNEIFVQFAYYTDGAFGSIGSVLLNWYGLSGDRRIGYISTSESGQIRIYTVTHPDGVNERATLRAQGNVRLKTNRWYVIEMRIKADPNFGALEVRVDGVPDCSFWGPTTEYNPGTIDSVRWGQFSCWIDDIVINDTTGTHNNSWPGCLKVVLLKPQSDGAYAEWTKSDEGHNYDMVNEVPFDPTRYVYTSGIGLRDLYNIENLPAEASEVSIVRGDAWCFKDSGSSAQNRTITFSVMPGVTITDSAAQDITLSYQLVRCPFDYNPDTGEIWSKEEVNSMQAGIKSSS